MAAHSRPLHLQTIDSLFAELIGGASVSVGEDGTEFSLSNADSRAILNWYRLNRAKWAGNVMTQDVEALVSAILTSPPTLPIPEIVKPKAGRKLRLVKVTAHRFGGLHAYGTAEEPPPDFEFSPDKPITLFEGWNGAGKTSILNSIIWCLTGSLLRPQRQPESGLEEFDSSFVRSEGASDETTSHSLTPITPLPNPDFYVPPVDKPIPIDSWVELVFVDQDGNELPPIRRTQLRNSRGRVSETPSGFEALGVDPIAFQLGTTMPAMLQFLRVGSTSDLGLAAARLTGLAEISALAKHAGKVKEKLKGDFKKNREKEIEGDDSSFQQARTDLQSEIDSFAEMAPTDPLPAPSGAKDVEQKLAALEAHFDALKAKTLAAAKSILGPDFDPTDKSERDNLEASIGPAQGQLKAMAQLPTVRRIRALGDLSDADWARVNKLVTKLHAEANILAELSNNPALERRKQLYARIANWISDGNDHDPTTCAVCSRSLAGITDPLTSQLVNTSHHNKTSLSAGDVYAILNDFESVLNLMEKMHIEFRHWRWQEPLQPATSPTNVVPFKPASVSKFKATVYPDLAAFTATSQHDTQEDVLEEIDETWFADKTLFLIRKDNLGFAVPDGCIAIAESTSYDGRDHNLVIARQKGHLLARRLFRPPHSDQLALAAEAPDPRNSKPTLLFTTEDIALHRIVGMLTEQPAPPLGRGEAIEIQSAKSLANIRAAYRVREDSGIPLALPGQIVLGGEVVERDQLHSTEGTLVALGLDDGSNVFKRIGESVPGSNGKLWQFESVGGLGKSLIVSLAEPDEEADAPKFIRARKIVGVLYT